MCIIVASFCDEIIMLTSRNDYSYSQETSIITYALPMLFAYSVHNQIISSGQARNGNVAYFYHFTSISSANHLPTQSVVLGMLSILPPRSQVPETYHLIVYYYSNPYV